MKKAAAALLLGFAGCATSLDLCGRTPLEGPSPHVYGGVRTTLAVGNESGCKAAGAAILIPDLPFSAILDTALLPITGPWALIRGTP